MPPFYGVKQRLGVDVPNKATTLRKSTKKEDKKQLNAQNWSDYDATTFLTNAHANIKVHKMVETHKGQVHKDLTTW